MPDLTITTTTIQKRIERHPVQRYNTMMNYYRGDHPTILNRPALPAPKPDNRMISNYPGYIVDVNLGYFMGVPVRYSSKTDDTKFSEVLKDIFKYNVESDENVELAKSMGIKGHTFELLYIDDDKRVRFDVVDPDGLIMVYDSFITPTPLYAIRFWEEETADLNGKMFYAEVYTAEKVFRYSGKNARDMVLIEELDHPFGDVPIVEFMNNDERQGDFEKVLSLIDAYDKSQSDTANDFEYFSDAYLKIKGMMGTDEETIGEMKKNRVILVTGEGDADWLVKQINDAALENYKTRLEKDIHKLSKVPNLTDEAFAGNLSGIALRYKLWGLEQNTAQKERKFKRGLQRRIELIANYYRAFNEQFDWRDIEITFTRNIPENILDISQVVMNLKGILSDETIIGHHPWVSDVEDEMARIEKENEGKIDLSNYLDDLREPEQDTAPIGEDQV
jgi:SPP1 family phage portal protein